MKKPLNPQYLNDKSQKPYARLRVPSHPTNTSTRARVHTPLHVRTHTRTHMRTHTHTPGCGQTSCLYAVSSMICWGRYWFQVNLSTCSRWSVLFDTGLCWWAQKSSSDRTLRSPHLHLGRLHGCHSDDCTADALATSPHSVWPFWTVPLHENC